MLFDTEAEYKAEIAEVRGYLKAGLERQAYDYTSGGPGSGAHEGWRRDPAAAQRYLEFLLADYAKFQAQTAAGSTSYVRFDPV